MGGTSRDRKISGKKWRGCECVVLRGAANVRPVMSQRSWNKGQGAPLDCVGRLGLGYQPCSGRFFKVFSKNSIRSHEYWYWFIGGKANSHVHRPNTKGDTLRYTDGFPLHQHCLVRQTMK